VPYATPLPGVGASVPFGREPNASFDTSAPPAANTFRYPPITSIRGYSTPDHDDDRRWPLDELAIAAKLTPSERSPSKSASKRKRSSRRSKR